MSIIDSPMWNTGLINNGKLEQVYELAVVKHGHWINVSTSITGNSSAECSLCGTVVHDTFADVNRINYCPHCGAKMDGIRREDD